MNDRVTIRAYRTEVFDRINRTFAALDCHRFQMVNVNVAVGGFAVGTAEGESARVAVGSVMRDALLAR